MKIVGKLVAKLGGFLFSAARKRLELLSATAVEEYRGRLRNQLSPTLLKALIVGEDHRYYGHPGVDLFAIAGAFWRFIWSGRLSGASTIEQQLVRVLTGERRRTVGRKMQEIMLACFLDTKYDKTELAGMYLAVAYFGWQMNGVEEACRRLRINPRNATMRQAVSLVARLKYPEPYSSCAERSALIARRTDHLLALLSGTRIALAEEVGSDAALLDT